MKIRFGYEIAYNSAAGVPMVVMLTAQPSATQRIVRSDKLHIAPDLHPAYHLDGFGNTCARFVCRGGDLTLQADGLIEDSGSPEPAVLDALEVPLESLPNDALSYLLGSRYCETDLLGDKAWRLFGHVAPGWNRVQAICDFVNQHVTFGYRYASSTKTAYQTYVER